MAHEFDLSDHEKAEWYSLRAETATPVSPEAIPDEIEDFAECFRLACLNPYRLSNIDVRKLEADIQGAEKAKVWQDPESGLVIKAAVGNQLLMEVKEFNAGKPPTAALLLPAACQRR